MTCTLYIVLSAFWLAYLALSVIRIRRKEQVRFGDGGVSALQVAQRIHGNAAEYLPILLILLVCLELNEGPDVLIHVAGIAFLTARLMHRHALLNDCLPLRVRSMQITFLTTVFLGTADLYYFFF